MVATGFLRLDIAGYGGLAITGKGRALLRGEGVFLYREETVVARPSAAPRETRKKVSEHPLNDSQAALLDVLKALRLELARDRGVPAYIVFPGPFADRHGAPAARAPKKNLLRSTASARPS